MPIIIPKDLPANKVLREENIFIMNELRALSQDIRPLKILILNLMPDKITTETQLLRLLSNFPIQIDIILLAIENHEHKNTPLQHLDSFYKTFAEVKDKKYDAMIITGAPIEQIPFEEVSYWQELKDIFEWTKENVFTTLFICWGAQAALYHFYGIDKELFDEKLFGVFNHEITYDDALFRGINSTFVTPHSRNSQSIQQQIKDNSNLDILAQSNKTGIHICANKSRSQIFFSGHFEYDETTLEKEYLRDLTQGKTTTKLPENYYFNDDPNQGIKKQWFSDASLVFVNWLNYYVYQSTNYNFVD